MQYAASSLLQESFQATNVMFELKRAGLKRRINCEMKLISLLSNLAAAETCLTSRIRDDTVNQSSEVGDQWR
jgi:hypothetical protein